MLWTQPSSLWIQSSLQSLQYPPWILFCFGACTKKMWKHLKVRLNKRNGTYQGPGHIHEMHTFHIKTDGSYLRWITSTFTSFCKGTAEGWNPHKEHKWKLGEPVLAEFKPEAEDKDHDHTAQLRLGRKTTHHRIVLHSTYMVLRSLWEMPGGGHS